MADLTPSTIPALPADDTVALEAGDDVAALPAATPVADNTAETPEAEDYEVVVNSPEVLANETAQAEQFGETLLSVQQIIQRYSEQFDTVKEKIKNLNESLGNLMDNDTELQELEQKAKTVTQDLKTRQQRVKESPEAVQLQMKKKEMQEEKKEIEESLNNHLLRYYQMTGSQVIENADGSEREFSVRASLRGKKKAGDE